MVKPRPPSPLIASKSTPKCSRVSQVMPPLNMASIKSRKPSVPSKSARCQSGRSRRSSCSVTAMMCIGLTTLPTCVNLPAASKTNASARLEHQSSSSSSPLSSAASWSAGRRTCSRASSCCSVSQRTPARRSAVRNCLGRISATLRGRPNSSWAGRWNAKSPSRCSCGLSPLIAFGAIRSRTPGSNFLPPTTTASTRSRSSSHAACRFRSTCLVSTSSGRQLWPSSRVRRWRWSSFTLGRPSRRASCRSERLGIEQSGLRNTRAMGKCKRLRLRIWSGLSFRKSSSRSQRPLAWLKRSTETSSKPSQIPAWASLPVSGTQVT
mmetsp:Transcript_22587/g.70895  ORF Transcript_22587/g.70895 Transcript_22587/m.70895 type:complete len:322 (-) Transcript_22587:1163-2128(-)